MEDFNENNHCEDFLTSLRLSRKFDRFTLKLISTIDKLDSLSNKQINQLSSTFDQMSKIIDDIMEGK